MAQNAEGKKATNRDLRTTTRIHSRDSPQFSVKCCDGFTPTIHHNFQLNVATQSSGLYQITQRIVERHKSSASPTCRAPAYPRGAKVGARALGGC